MKPNFNCPKCGWHVPQQIDYTWWGGLVIPKLINQCRCPKCSFEYSANSGKGIQGIKNLSVGIIAAGSVALAIFVISQRLS